MKHSLCFSVKTEEAINVFSEGTHLCSPEMFHHREKECGSGVAGAEKAPGRHGRPG